MILSTHFLTGAAVISHTNSPVLLIILPLLLHFILDMIPHWEYVEVASELKRKIPQLILDIIAGPIIIVFASIFIYGLDLKTILWLFVGGTISVIPDGFSLLHILSPKNELLKQIFAFHQAIHNKKMLGWKFGFVFQIALDALAIIIIVLPKA